MFRSVALGAGVLFLALSAPAFSSQDSVLIDKSRIPALAGDVNKIAPSGWKLEEQVTGDLNGDGLADYALKLVEDKPAKDKDDVATERARALVIVLQGKDGKLARAAVADKLLQCTRCGGAFYGIVESPAGVKIEKGVIVVEQDHGSRDLTNTTYRFRYDPDTQKFVLIGFDYADSDRMTAQVVTESTNYLTGVRKVSREKGKRTLTSSTQIPKKKIFLDDVDYEKFEEEAAKRLHLD
jgi:hypothetical protein